MYTSYFGFQHKPFNLCPDPRFFYCGPVHRRVVAETLSALQARTGTVVLTGPAGTGKTAVLRKILGRLHSGVEAVVLQYPNVDLDGVMTLLADGLNGELLDGPRLERVEQIHDLLESHLMNGLPVVLFVDEAQNLRPDALQLLFQLARTETDAGPLMQLVLIGQSEISTAIESLDLTSAVALDLKLAPLNQGEISDFVRHQLHAAGCRSDDLFDDDAIANLYHHTQGNPRLLNLLCDKALAHVCHAGGTRVSAETVEQAARSPLDGPRPAAPETSAPDSVVAPNQDSNRAPLAAIRSHFAEVFGTLESDLKTAKTKVSMLMKGRARLDRGWLSKFTDGGRQQSGRSRFDVISGVAVACGVLVLSLVFMAPKSEPDWDAGMAADSGQAQELAVSRTESGNQQTMVISIPEADAAPQPLVTTAVVEVDANAQMTEPAPQSLLPGVAADSTSTDSPIVQVDPAEIEALQSDLQRVIAANQELALQLEAMREERDRYASAMGLGAAPVQTETRTAVPASQSTTSAAPSSPKPPTGASQYRVAPGDTLWGIAQRHGVSVEQLAAWNQLTPQSVLRTGQTLQVAAPTAPTGETVVVTEAYETQKVAGNDDGVAIRYTVQRGDTLYGIARRFKVSVTDLNRWNSLDDGRQLQAGETIRVVRTL